MDGGERQRSAKRKMGEIEEPMIYVAAARVEIEIEVAALREALASHQQTVADLCEELEEERAAAASAADEAMSMILRLQREKADAQMEARQYKRLAEEKMLHDQQELETLEDKLFVRERAIQALSGEIQAYRRRLLRLGVDLTVPEPDEDSDPSIVPESICYPPLKCGGEEFGSETVTAVTAEEHLRNLGRKMEHSDPLIAPENIKRGGGEIGPEAVTAEEHLSLLCRRMDHPDPSIASEDFCYPCLKCDGQEIGSEAVTAVTAEEHLKNLGRRMDHLEREDQEMEKNIAVDRIYTIDSVHGGDQKSDQDQAIIKKLYKRLEALEADRESMRQAIVSMSTDKAQLFLLKEIAQNLYKESFAAAAAAAPSEKAIYRPNSSLECSVFYSVMKWIMSGFFWRQKPQRNRRIFGAESNSRAGLRQLLEKPSPSYDNRQIQRFFDVNASRTLSN